MFRGEGKCDASGTWYLSVNTYRTCIILRTSAFIAFIAISKVTTVHLNLESSRSFEVFINTRIPKHPALLTLSLLFWFLFSCVLCLVKLQTWGFTVSILLLLSFFWPSSYTNLRYITSYLSTSTKHPLDSASHLVPCPKYLIRRIHQVSHLASCARLLGLRQRTHLVQTWDNYSHQTQPSIALGGVLLAAFCCYANLEILHDLTRVPRG